MKTIAVLGLFLLGACASSIMQSYVGKNIEEAILDYGPPANILDMSDGKRAYQWQMTDSTYIPGHASSVTSGNVIGNYGTVTTNTRYTPPMVSTQECTYTLIAEPTGKQWIVTSFRQPRFWCE